MNKDLSISNSDLLQTRLEILISSLNFSYFNNQIIESEIVSSYNNAINIFLSSLNSCVSSSIRQINSGDKNDPVSYNIFMDSINSDLSILFSELFVLSNIISSSFNSLFFKYNNILNNIRNIGSKIGDFLLYSDPNLGAGYFYYNNFESSEKIDIQSSLLQGDECLLSPEEGIVLLPLDGEPSRINIEKVIINTQSNGIAGNNYQINAVGHNQIEAILDGKPNTWFEYEKVSTNQINYPLILDITLKLKESSIINFINIVPINFGTATPIEIKEIETSENGEVYVSILDAIPIKDYINETRSSKFKLASSIYSTSGQGIYSFDPRKTQYIHFIFEQSTPYNIKTILGDKLRYAIGLKDINIYSRKFKSSGSLISNNFSSNKEVKKISLWSSEFPFGNSELSSISHFISSNNGGTWNPIQPQNIESDIGTEVLNFNTFDKNSINTSSPVSSFRYKLSLTRNKDAFSGEAIIKDELNSLEEIVSIGNTISLQQKPIEETVSIVAPYYGSFSHPREKSGSSVKNISQEMELDTINFIASISDGNSLKYKLPIIIPNIEEHIRVFVNGSQIEYCPKLDSAFSNPTPTSYTTIDENSRVYFINNTELQFRYIDSLGTSRGFLPAAGSEIQVCFDGDNPVVELTEDGYLVNLSCYSTGDKENTKLYSLIGLEETDTEELNYVLPSGQKIVKIPNSSGFLYGVNNFYIREYDLSGNLITGDSRQYKTRVNFTSGLLDVSGWGNTTYTDKYTFNYNTGTLYLSSSVSSDRKVVFICKRLRRKEINNWKFYEDVNNKINLNKIIIPSNQFNIIEQEYIIDGSLNMNKIQLCPTNTSAFSWSNKKVIKGSLFLSSSLFNNIEPSEVIFIDGETEFEKLIFIDSEKATFTESSLGTNLWIYELKGYVSDSTIEVTSISGHREHNERIPSVSQFSIDNQVESISEVSSSLVNGAWCIQNGILYLRYDSTPIAHDISYKIFNSSYSPDYSVDYNNGVIYFASPVTNAGSIKYSISLLSAFYNIGLSLDKDIEKINTETKTIQFNNSFMTKFFKQDVINKSRPQIINVSYKYNTIISQSLSEIEPYFSPSCSSIAIRAITSDLLDNL